MFATSQANTKDLKGIPLFVTTSDTTVGAIDQSTNAFFRPERIQIGTTSGFTSSAVFAVNGISAMRKLINSTAYGNDTVDVFFASQDVAEAFDKEVETKEYINKTTQAMADLGFEVAEYKGKTIIWDRYMGTGGSGLYNYIYAINTKHLWVAYNSKRWFYATPFEPISSDIIGKVSKILVSVGLISNSLRTQGVGYGWTTL